MTTPCGSWGSVRFHIQSTRLPSPIPLISLYDREGGEWWWRIYLSGTTRPDTKEVPPRRHPVSGRRGRSSILPRQTRGTSARSRCMGRGSRGCCDCTRPTVRRLLPYSRYHFHLIEYPNGRITKPMVQEEDEPRLVPDPTSVVVFSPLPGV